MGMRALVIDYGRVREVEVDSLADMQGLVGGNVELFGPGAELFDGVDLFVNEEGLSACFPNRCIVANEAMAEAGYVRQFESPWPSKRRSAFIGADEVCTVLYGPILAVGWDDEDGSSVSLTEDQIEAVKTYFDGGDRRTWPGSGAAWVDLLRRRSRL